MPPARLTSSQALKVSIPPVVMSASKTPGLRKKGRALSCDLRYSGRQTCQVIFPYLYLIRKFPDLPDSFLVWGRFPAFCGYTRRAKAAGRPKKTGEDRAVFPGSAGRVIAPT
jgi:hypothetical protein